MTERSSKSLDVLGVKPLGDSVHTVTKAVVDGAAAFLSRICLPAAEEFGLLLRDRISHWRASNAAQIAAKAERLLGEQADSEERHAHPRLVAQIIEHGSWTAADEVQEMWAGLLASACDVDGSDDSNLIFVDLLSRLTLPVARVFDHACKESQKEITTAGWITAANFTMSLEQLRKCTGIDDFHRIDRELDHLHTLGLIEGAFGPNSTDADVTPTALALQMYARCHGWSGSPLDFYGVSAPSSDNIETPS